MNNPAFMLDCDIAGMIRTLKALVLQFTAKAREGRRRSRAHLIAIVSPELPDRYRE
ncbi:MAG: hypothetical protein AABY88_04375 [Pseudomonadota bacterium]